LKLNQPPVHIPASRRRITIGYAGLSLSFPERVRYRYRLEGFDRGWSEPNGSREAGYTNLNPGNYVFRVTGTNSNGVWNSQEAILSLQVEPAFWQTFGFRAATLLTVLLAIVTAYQYRMQQTAKHLNLLFEERLAERARIAQELHDTLLQGCISASMLLYVTAENLPSESPAKPALSGVVQLMNQVIEEGRNAVRGLRSTPGAQFNLEQAFSQIREEFDDDQLEFCVIIEGFPKPLHPIIRDETYRIGREALINAFRHAQAKNIEVALEYAEHYFRLLVRDDGKGIQPDVLQSGGKHHWGLSGMRERAERLGARLRVWSRPAAGTEIELYIPRHIAYEQRSSALLPRKLLTRVREGWSRIHHLDD
jgi:signal transduction histidine kinase